MIEFNPALAPLLGNNHTGDGPGLPPDEEEPPPSNRVASSNGNVTADTIEVSGQALNFPAASSDNESTGYAGAATYSSAGQSLATTGGLLDISG